MASFFVNSVSNLDGQGELTLFLAPNQFNIFRLLRLKWNILNTKQLINN